MGTKVKGDNFKNSLPLMEQFYSIQGEGYYSGRPAIFIRLAGCDVGCIWCDVKESWNKNEHAIESIEKIICDVQETNCKFIVITGGEPAMYDLTNLTNELKLLGCEIAIETSGVYPIIGTIDWVCFSPKKFKKPNVNVFGIANELKVIVFNKSDFSWAQDYAAKVGQECKLYLQPEWSKEKEMTPLIIDFVKKNPDWNISLQTHKYLDIR